MAVPQQHDNLPGQMPSREQDVPSLFSDFDLYLFGQGKHFCLLVTRILANDPGFQKEILQ